MDLQIILLRFGIVFILSMLFGIERQKAHKPIGFGTIIFVSLGSCALTISALTVFPESPVGLLAAIVSGIGFLGAGALIKTTDKIFGFTSAASIWLFAIIGLIVGIGSYDIAVIVYVLMWIVVLFDRYLEAHGIGSYQRKIMVTTTKIVNEKQIRNIILSRIKQCKLMSAEIDKTKQNMTISYLIEGTKESINSIPQELWQKDWFSSCKLE
jgi:uncharacterized membrane protein YhiD involved in acid resistance